jgi:hypothetical protein
MVQKLKRQVFVVAVVAAVAALAGSAALAAPGHGRNGNKLGARGAFGPFGGAQFGGLGGFGFGGPGFGGPGFEVGRGGPWGGERGPGAGILSADVLTPAASFLGISVSTLTADLKAGKTLAQEATAKGKTAAALIDAVVAAQKTVLDAENAAGWITDAQETSLLSRLTDQITTLVNTGPPVPPVKKSGPLDAAATYIGASVTDIQADLKAGKTLAQIATAHGKTVDGLVAALTAQAKTNLDAAVTAGRITAAQEQTLLANVTARVTDLVNNAKSASPAMAKIQAFFKR